MDEAAFQPPPKILEAIMASTRELGFQSWCWPQVGALEALAARQDFRRIYINWSSGVVVMVKSGA
jgi:hypothetical protein